MNHSELQTTRRHLPHWHLAGSVYFITFRLATGTLADLERTILVTHIRNGHRKSYDLIAAVIMPDHAHVLLRPNDEVDLSRITKGIKGASARLINEHRCSTGSIWQEESFDRIIRDQAEYDEKLTYIVNNPVKAGLIADGFDYPWLYLANSTDG